MMLAMITRERAVALVEALLADQPQYVICHVGEYDVGWLITYQSARYMRTRDFMHMLVGNSPYLVDREDGSIHVVPEVHLGDDWQAHYRAGPDGIQPPDPVPPLIRAVLDRDGFAAAYRRLRREAPQFSAAEAKAYVDAMRRGGEPGEDLLARTRPPRERLALSIEAVPPS